MTPGFIKLDQVDIDGALEDSAGSAVATLEADGDTRADFFKKAGLAGGAALSGGALLAALVPGTALGAGRPPASFGRGDIGILNFALTLEYLEAAFYNEATANNRKSSFIKNRQIGLLLKRVTADENVHVKTLKGALGSKAVPSPKFDFRGTTKAEKIFIQTTASLENTGVHAYLGQAGNIKSTAILGTAGSILTIEARHASVAGLLFQKTSGSISPDGPFDVPFSANRVLKAVAKTKFIIK